MDPFEALNEHVGELIESLQFPQFVVGGPTWGLTNYFIWAIIIFIILLVVVFTAGKKLSLVPKSKFANMVEYGYDFVRKDMAESNIGHGYEKHVPFLATLFFFILIANFVGLIPGAKAASGTLGVTWALAIISFVYFNYWGVKAHGGWGYIKAIAPSGLPKPLVPVVWFFEFISLCLRALTLAVRLYGNMFAGHMVIGIFAILTSVFIQAAIQNAAIATALPSLAWFFFILFMYALECLVAFLQAYVFTTLSAVYIGLATSSH
ncbi:MAG: F0F1 ATP synthase subunit A [Eggerthellaceae bacterium]|nr:F0F1 ATP synthase subunit A [Eggerthellaceae bacterium]MBR3258303.1 F0F1 ATP synthase subunit A [Eggerthellaceae bacterium]